MGELRTLPIYCSHCGLPVALEIERESIELDRAKIGAWTCPGCEAQNYLNFDGRVLGVSPGHDHRAQPKA